MLIGAKELGNTIFTVENSKMTVNLTEDVARKLWENYYVPFVKGWFAGEGRFRSDDIKTGNVLGYVGSQTVLDETDMMNVAVSAQARRRGIAQALVEALVIQLKQRGSRCLTLEVRASNVPAIALYEKLGFRQVGRRPNYYSHPKEDGLILRKEWEI